MCRKDSKATESLLDAAGARTSASGGLGANYAANMALLGSRPPPVPIPPMYSVDKHGRMQLQQRPGSEYARCVVGTMIIATSAKALRIYVSTTTMCSIKCRCLLETFCT